MGTVASREVVSSDFPTVNRFNQRAARARELALVYPAASASLEFFARVSELQGVGASRDAYAALTPVAPPEEWLERVVAELTPEGLAAEVGNLCPKCSSPPQLGILRQQGDGHALYLACALCREEWAFSRKVCPNCESEAISFASAESLPGYQTLTCDSCKVYLHLLEEGKLRGCVPEADEIAAQALDVWAMEQGYHKLTPNLVGV